MAETPVANISISFLGVRSLRHPVVTSGCILGLPGNVTSSANTNAVVHAKIITLEAFFSAVNAV